MAAQSSAQLVETLLLFALVIAIVFLRRRSIGVQGQVELQHGERIRLMAMEWLEPVIALVVAGLVLYDELSQGTAHWLAAALGVALGIPFGLLRGRLIYVRSEPQLAAIVLRRNRFEYLALAALLVINFFGEYVKQTTEWLSLLVTVALVLVVAESFTRVAWTTIQYRRSRRDL